MINDDAKLKAEFDRELMNVYLRAKTEANYVATIFHNMLVDLGGTITAKRLINGPVSEGYTALWERKRLDLTVEAVVVDNTKWHILFDDEEIKKARKRLTDYGYTRDH